MTVIERRAYTENVAAQEAAYWYCREHGIRANDLDIGQILQVAGPIILQGAVEERDRLRAELDALRESRDAWRLQAMREHDEGLPE